MKKIFGIFGLLETDETGALGSVAPRRLTCRSRLHRGRSAAKTPRPLRAAPDADDIMRRWQPYPIDPATRRDATEEDLRWLEDEVGGPLPPEYRHFLRGYGWTGFAPAVRFPILEASPFGTWAELSSFLGFSSEIRRDLAYLLSESYAGLLPKGTLPIATDTRGNLVLLSVLGDSRGGARGRVWFWDRECRGLDDQIDTMVADLEAEGEDTFELDENQIMRRWETLFPQRRSKPGGFGNLYAAADSFVAFLESLY